MSGVRRGVELAVAIFGALCMLAFAFMTFVFAALDSSSEGRPWGSMFLWISASVTLGAIVTLGVGIWRFRRRG